MIGIPGQHETHPSLIFARVRIQGEVRPHLLWLHQAERSHMISEHVLRRSIQVLGEECRSSLALQTSEEARAAVDEVSEPIFDVRRIGARLDQFQFDDVTTLERSPVDVGHVARLDGIELPHRAHPAQAGDRIPFASEPGRADTATHLRHSQDENFLSRHG
jgi:hypothetical protein